MPLFPPSNSTGQSTSGKPTEPSETLAGRYRLHCLLGRGGNGEVWEADDVRIDRRVAVKILTSRYTEDATLLERFLREARESSKIADEHVVRVLDAQLDPTEGRPFLVMELVRGMTAADLIRSEPPNWNRAVRITGRAGLGLRAVHVAGVIHRDLKPSNIMLSTEDGAVKLTDFGLCRPMDNSGRSLTSPHEVLGTPNYMSPEQCRGKGEPPTVRTDIYGLGATFYALLTGRPPFVRDTHLDVMFAHCFEPVPDPRTLNAEIPPRCAEVVLRALAKDPRERFASVEEMVDALREVLRAGPSAAQSSGGTTSNAGASTAGGSSIFSPGGLPASADAALGRGLSPGGSSSGFRVPPGASATSSSSAGSAPRPAAIAATGEFHLSVPGKWFSRPTSTPNADWQLVARTPALVRLQPDRQHSFGAKFTLSDAGLRELAGLARPDLLCALGLSGCRQLTDAGLVYLRELTGLRKLDLGGGGVLGDCDWLTDAGLEHIAVLTGLESLNLSGCRRITDAGLARLAALVNLQQLDLTGCPAITRAGLPHFTSAVPRCRVSR